MGDKDEEPARLETGLRDAAGERRVQLHVDETIAQLVITPLDQSAAEVMAQTLAGGDSSETRSGPRQRGGSR